MLGCLEYNRITGSQSGADFHGCEKELGIPRHYGRYNTKRFAERHGDHVGLVDRQCRALNFVGASGVIMEKFGNIFCLPASLFEHLAGVDGFGAAKQLRMLSQQIGQPP